MNRSTCHTLWLYDQSTTSLLQIGLSVAIKDHHCQQVDVYIVRCSPTSPCLSARYQSGLVVPLVAHSIVNKLLKDILDGINETLNNKCLGGRIYHTLYHERDFKPGDLITENIN